MGICSHLVESAPWECPGLVHGVLTPCLDGSGQRRAHHRSVIDDLAYGSEGREYRRHSGFSQDGSAHADGVDLDSARGQLGEPRHVLLEPFTKEPSEGSTPGRGEGRNRIEGQRDRGTRSGFEAEVEIGIETVGARRLDPSIGFVDRHHLGTDGAQLSSGGACESGQSPELPDDDASTLESTFGRAQALVFT